MRPGALLCFHLSAHPGGVHAREDAVLGVWLGEALHELVEDAAEAEGGHLKEWGVVFRVGTPPQSWEPQAVPVKPQDSTSTSARVLVASTRRQASRRTGE